MFITAGTSTAFVVFWEYDLKRIGLKNLSNVFARQMSIEKLKQKDATMKRKKTSRPVKDSENCFRERCVRVSGANNKLQE